MKYEMVKYERGQVWMIRRRNQSTVVGKEQDKDRPWLILSIGKFNSSSGMFTAVPITTRDKVRTPAQVHFINEYGRDQVVLGEQIRTFDYSSNEYITEYLGTVSQEILEQVDVAISIHLGLHYSPITLNKLYDSMEAVIKSVSYMQQKASTPIFTDDDVLNFAEKLQSLVPQAAQEEVAVTQNVTIDLDTFDKPPMDDMTHRTEVTIESPSEKKVVKCAVVEEVSTKEEPKPQRIKWTKENCEEFLQDAENLPMVEVMKKWNMSKKTRFYSMKSYVRDLLKKMNGQST